VRIGNEALLLVSRWDRLCRTKRLMGKYLVDQARGTKQGINLKTSEKDTKMKGGNSQWSGAPLTKRKMENPEVQKHNK